MYGYEQLTGKKSKAVSRRLSHLMDQQEIERAKEKGIYEHTTRYDKYPEDRPSKSKNTIKHPKMHSASPCEYGLKLVNKYTPIDEEP